MALCDFVRSKHRSVESNVSGESGSTENTSAMSFRDERQMFDLVVRSDRERSLQGDRAS